MRPKTFDPDEALSLALERFWKSGFESTNMPDLLDHMGVGRASFYNAFGSKREIFLRTLDLYFAALDNVLRGALEGIESREAAVAALVHAILNVAKTNEGWRGCLIGNTALEMGQKDAEIHQQLMRGIAILQKHFLLAIAKPAGKKKHVQKNAEAASLRFVAGVQGLLVLSKAGLSETDIAAARDALIHSFH
jgi:TetR/AcrR family transcriptional regulator, transcriptional repressor for nem operon